MSILNRRENYLAKIAGSEDAVEMTPANRKENFLAKIAGSEDAVEMTPANRTEAALNEIVGGSAGPSGTKTITKNDTYDVTDYAYAEVNVPTGWASGNVTNGTVTVKTGGYTTVVHNAVQFSTNGDGLANVQVKRIQSTTDIIVPILRSSPNDTYPYYLFVSMNNGIIDSVTGQSGGAALIAQGGYTMIPVKHGDVIQFTAHSS